MQLDSTAVTVTLISTHFSVVYTYYDVIVKLRGAVQVYSVNVIHECILQEVSQLSTNQNSLSTTHDQ